jgi:hypothetical protein
MASVSLPDDDHVVRHIPNQLLEFDSDDKVIGCLPQAFELRRDEEYLSARWLEFFDGTDEESLAAVACCISRTRKVNGSQGFAIGQVSAVKEACASFDQKVRILHEPDDDAPSYAAVRRYKSEPEQLLALLAGAAWGRTVSTEPSLLKIGPWRPRPR